MTELMVPDAAFLELATAAGYSKQEIEWAAIFWDATFNGSWIYLSNEMIIEWMGHAADGIWNFCRNMRKKYKEGEEYKEVDRTHEIVQKYYESRRDLKLGGSRKRHYIITGHTLKKMLMRAKTSRGDQICDYFIKTENLAKKHKQPAAEARPHKERKETIYIATTKQYSQLGLFKIGKTKNPAARLSSLNTGRIKGDEIKILAAYAVYNSDIVERLLHCKLEALRHQANREFFRCRYSLLKQFCEVVTRHDHAIDEEADRVLQEMAEARRDEAPDEDFRVFDVPLIKAATGWSAGKFDIRKATPPEIEAFVRECIAAYRGEFGGDIIWANMKTIISKLSCVKPYALPMTEYRDEFGRVAQRDELRITWRAGKK